MTLDEWKGKMILDCNQEKLIEDFLSKCFPYEQLHSMMEWKEGKPLIMPILIDADIIAWRCASASDGMYYTYDGAQGYEFPYVKDIKDYCEGHGLEYDVSKREKKYRPEPVSHAIHSMTEMIDSIMVNVNSPTMDPNKIFSGDLRFDLKKTLFNSSGKFVKNEVPVFDKNTTIVPFFFLSCPSKDGFRMEINPEYKANRADQRVPEHLKALKSYLLEEYNAFEYDKYEADDLLGIMATYFNKVMYPKPIIASIDKDLLMVDCCFHYDFLKTTHSYNCKEYGLNLLFKQILTGDSTDNIEGLHGVGPAKSAQIVGAKKYPGRYENTMVINTINAYFQFYAEGRMADTTLKKKYPWNREAFDAFIRTGEQIFIRRYPDETFEHTFEMVRNMDKVKWDAIMY